MSDDFDDDETEVRHLDQAEVQEILDWATQASGTVTLMHFAPEHETPDEAVERLNGYIEAIAIMYDMIPDCLVDAAHIIASNAIERVEHEEAIVEDFLNDIKDL